MATKSSGASLDKRRKYDDAFKAEDLRLANESRSTQAAARQLGINPKLLYRWQQAQFVAEVGSEEGARDPEVWALRARLKRAEQELDILKESLCHFQLADPVSTYCHIAQCAVHVSVRRLCQVLRVALAAYYAWQLHRQRWSSRLGKWPCAKRLPITSSVTARGDCRPRCRPRARAGATWPSGSTGVRAKSSAGACALAMPEDLLSEALRRASWCAAHPSGSSCIRTKS